MAMRARTYVLKKCREIRETREKREKVLADTGTYLFPKEIEKTGNPGKDGALSGRPFLDLNLAKPQRSDWWTGDLMAEVDHAAPPPGDPLPISPSDVRAGVARELRALAEDGREGPDALAGRHRDHGREDPEQRSPGGAPGAWRTVPRLRRAPRRQPPVIAVLSGKPGAPASLHAACHDVYRARRTALVDRIMTAAGYGETLTNGAAA